MFSPHPGERDLMRAVRRHPLDPRTWMVRWHLLWCGACRDCVHQADAELADLFYAQVFRIDNLNGSYQQSARRLLGGMRSLGTANEAKHQKRVRRRNILLVGAGVVAACVGASLILLTPRHETQLTAATVLAKAAAQAEDLRVGLQPGVVLQHLLVVDGDEKDEWMVYRDRQGRRKPRFQAASTRESLLRQRLASAGITREDPLSVSSYRSWRSSLGAHTDSVVFSPSGLIVVKTSAGTDPRSPVREETLMLREMDYHAISRSVTFRDAGTVEIAELDYRVLDWSEARKDWFEDVETAVVPVPHNVARDVPVMKERKPDPAELDLAELKARLVLSERGADTGEQIEVLRTGDGVRVEGLASTPERKDELVSALEDVPNVTVRLNTPEERAASEGQPSTPTRIKVIESGSQPSPLLVYLQGEHQPIDSYRQFSAKMMDSALRISQQCHALNELQAEFGSRMPLDEPARQVYGAVFNNHVAKLKFALTTQADILKTLNLQNPDGALRNIETGAASLRDMAGDASRSLELSRELVAGQGSNQRDAALILKDLALENSTLTADLDGLQAPRH
jgi:hypothetical protein